MPVINLPEISYAPYDSNYNKIHGRIVLDAPAPMDDTLVIDLTQQSYVYTTPLTQLNVLVSTGQRVVDFTLDLSTVTYTTILGPFYIGGCGSNYQLRLTYGGNYSYSPPFDITIIPVDAVKFYTEGFQLFFTEIMDVIGTTPIAGMTVKGLSPDHDSTTYLLEVDAPSGQNRRARWSRYDTSWGEIEEGFAGEWIALPNNVANGGNGAWATVKLPDNHTPPHYITIKVDPENLPVTNPMTGYNQQVVNLAPKTMEEPSFIRLIHQAARDLQRDVNTRFWPTPFFTQQCDLTGLPLLNWQYAPVTQYDPVIGVTDFAMPLNGPLQFDINLGITNIIEVSRLVGRGSNLNLPYTASELDYNREAGRVTPRGYPAGSVYLPGILPWASRVPRPDYWNYAAIAGVGEANGGRREDINLVVGKRAAALILFYGGTGRTVGTGGISAGIDGASDNMMFSGGDYGPYSQRIQPLIQDTTGPALNHIIGYLVGWATHVARLN